MKERIDISDLTKAEVLAVLYNYAVLRRAGSSKKRLAAKRRSPSADDASSE